VIDDFKVELLVSAWWNGNYTRVSWD